MESKPWFASKTLWVNALAGIASLSTAFGFDLGLDAESQAAIVGGVMALANIILRLVTRKPLSLGKETTE